MATSIDAFAVGLSFSFVAVDVWLAAGVIGAVCGQVGSVMAGEAIKLITGIGEPLLGRLLVIDVLRGRWDEVPLRRSPARAARPAPENPDAEASACAVAARPRRIRATAFTT